MSVIVGVVLALVTCLIGRLSGLDRDRAFYPTALIAIATYDVLFAVVGGSTSALLIECALATVFTAAALIGFKRSEWIVAAAYAAHGIADLVHHSFSANAGIPDYWPGFCSAFDLVVAAILVIYRLRNAQATLQTGKPGYPVRT